MKIERCFTEAENSPYSGIGFRKATSEIRNPDGSIVFRLEGIQVPSNWSQVASDIIAQKYFRKAGVPARLKRVEENSVPSWLWRSVEDKEALLLLPEDERYSSETDSRQVFDRLAGLILHFQHHIDEIPKLDAPIGEGDGRLSIWIEK